MSLANDIEHGHSTGIAPPAIDPEQDARFMAAAIALGHRNLGRAWPNPSVGAIIVRETASGPRVVGRGMTGAGGRPHAEAVALSHAGALARGATCYVSLEPCSHYGRTAPCSAALIKAGVARVVSAIEDPNPEVAGKGHQMLREAGIDVTVGVAAEAARRLHAGHIRRITRNRPHILLKLAVSGDGMIGRRDAGQVAITGPAARRRVHAMRAHSDAIAIGIQTALNDDPELTCRLPGMESRSPVRVVFDTSARLPVSARMFQTVDETPIWVIVGEDALQNRRDALEAAGATTIPVPVDVAGRIDFAVAMSTLAACGLTAVMVEGGARLAETLVRGGFVDEAAIFTGPGEIGGEGIAALGPIALSDLLGDQSFSKLEDRYYGPDHLKRLWREE